MKIYLRLFVCLLATLMCLCSCGVKYDYDENGEFRVVDGQLPEELPKPADFIWRAPMKGYVSLQDYLDQTSSTIVGGYVIFRAQKITSESLSTKDSSLEYTITELEILDVYERQGERYQNLAKGDTVDIVENYTFVPDGNKLTFKKVDIVRIYPDQEHRSSLSDGRAYVFVQPEKEYIVILFDRFPERKTIIANGESGQCIVSNDQRDSIFVPDMIQAIDEQRYADMLTKEEYTLPVEKRPGKKALAAYDYFYFDILSQYVFVEK